MIKYHRTLQPFKVISFDLDDTLYDNTQTIQLAVQHFLEHLKDLSKIPELTYEYWGMWKMKVQEEYPLLAEDVIAWRIKTIEELLKHHHKSAVEIKHISEQTMKTFIKWRHKIDVPEESIYVLEQLAKKYPLVALTNGNVEPTKIGLNQFQFVWRGGKQGRAKPHPDLFQQTTAYFKIQPQEILHIGDNLISDIQGAIQANCQAVWLNVSEKSHQFTEKDTLPTVEIDKLPLLLELV
ncbi:putative hydrolase of the HAD superfamily [Bisgaardia hudsonensis]|uniref:Putative hydrolase of the HAD superfamily n=1 Tax=Bisgaardia hudsonensis TaxID=109472 RepID=A0A4R2MYQ2_9PAST|nr:putative hydrolase of the HAD superfamily [Bisgaardia hudsonensis]